jgi:small basic protein
VTNDDRIQVTAVIALLAALLGALWALQHGFDPQGVALVSGLAYGAALAFTGPLQAPLGESVVTSIKYAAVFAVFGVWVLGAGAYAGWQLLRERRSEKGVFA